MSNKTEELREALIDLERINIKEREVRAEAEALLAGLQVLTTGTQGSDIFAGLLSVLKEAIGFENAFIMVADGENDLRTIASTSENFLEAIWAINEITSRITVDHPIAFFDVALVPDWRKQAEACRREVCSALHVLLRTPPKCAVLICTHSQKGFFGARQLRLATRFAPLASQALRNLDYTVELERMNIKLEHEIKERIHAEEMAMKSQLQVMNSSKMAALGEMAGGIAHEINTPLATIQIVAEQLAEVISEEPLNRDLVKEMAATITTTTRRISKIIVGMRAFVKNSILDPLIPESVQRIIDETLILCAEKFKNQGIKLEVAHTNSGLKAECRANEIAQILINLLNNAYDAVEALPPEKKWVNLQVSEDQNVVKISVTDGGAGVSDTALSRLFQPFHTTKEIGKGTGLSLSVSKRIAEAHGGDLYFQQDAPCTKFVLQIKKAP